MASPNVSPKTSPRRQCPEADPRAYTKHKKDHTKTFEDHLRDNTGEQASEDQGGLRKAAENSPFINMIRTILPSRYRSALESIRTGKPGKSALSAGKTNDESRARQARVSPEVPEPRSGGYRPAKVHTPKELLVKGPDKWDFSTKERETRKRLLRGRADHQLGILTAQDLEDELWFLWLDMEPQASGDAAAGNQESLNLGSMKFLIDTGCGQNLIAMKYIRNSGALDKIKRLKVPLTLNTAGGQSRAVGSVSISCSKMMEGSFESVIMPETPSVISVGERCMDHGYSFHWRAGRKPYLLLPNGKRLNLTVEGKYPT